MAFYLEATRKVTPMSGDDDTASPPIALPLALHVGQKGLRGTPILDPVCDPPALVPRSGSKGSRRRWRSVHATATAALEISRT